ncbi:30S ribosomal protein S4 [Candidatus Woesearchaeota archaeon]|nr:30S ribosomal protein S4 [Candidatus Woesearchaeota archaeon]
MGDPKKQRKKYETPRHPWRKERIDRDKLILKEFGLKNRREILKMEHILRRFRKQAKNLKALDTEQSKKEQKQLITKLTKLSLLNKDSSLDDVLALSLDSILNRRLQTLLVKKGLAKTVSQSRQFVTHGHISINNKKITSPSYIVPIEEESLITFRPSSKLSNSEHPERVIKEKIEKIKKKVEE